jgi:succinylarginine dihydrolase
LHFSDEGAANHIRLRTSKCYFHLFAWGRSAFQAEVPKPRLFPARQTLEASQSLARLHRLPGTAVGFPRQNEAGIDAGAFHTDVLGVGNDQFLMLHELAFAEQQRWISDLKTHLGDELSIIVASENELPVQNAVKSYPFNSQVLTLPDGSMVIVAPTDSEEDDYSRQFLQRVVDAKNPVKAVHFLDVRQSMQNGGGPACLRLRVRLSSDEVAGIAASVFYNETMHQKLLAWCEHHYRDRLSKEDLADPLFHRESMTALDELTRILKLGSVYDFQRDS